MKKLLIVLVVLLVGFVGGAFLIDSQVRVTRSVVIDAPPAAIHPWVEDLTKFDDWATFDDGDDKLEYVWGETTRGEGAWRSWSSELSGKGTQTITRSDVDQGVWMSLEMEGFDPTTVAVTYKPVDGGTEVQWTDEFDMGSHPVYRWMGLMMESVVGPVFEESLANLKAEVERTQA